MNLVAADILPDNKWVSFLIDVPLKIFVIILISFGVWFVIIRIISRVTREFASKADADRLTVARRSKHTTDLTALLMSQRRRQRAEAIASLLRSITTLCVAGIATLLVLAQLNINITPLLASAGVVGVALGFGAQSLVKDYLSGIFLILEDQFGVGDIVDLGPVVGTVEEVSLRVTQLRDMTGVVWYVRNGEVLRVANQSQGWTMAIVDVPIAYDEDLERVRELVEAVADEMDNDAAYDQMLLDKPAYAGVESVSGDAVIIRVTAKAAPEQQAAVTRILRERLKRAFDLAGVRLPNVSSPVATEPEAAALPGPGQPPPPDYGIGPPKP